MMASQLQTLGQQNSSTAQALVPGNGLQHAMQLAPPSSEPHNGAGLLHRSNSWDEVLNSIEAAREEYEKKTGKGRLRAIPRSQVVVTTLHGLTEMIPEQEGLSVLRGGLKLIFGLLHKRIENQEQIFQTFQDIPFTFSKACEACQSYPRDEALRNSVFDLYQVLREEIPNLTGVLLRRHKGSLPSRVFKQHPQNEARVISDAVDAVARASARVTDRVETLLGKTVVATLHQTEAINSNVRQVGMGVKLIHDRQLEAEQRFITQEQRYSEELNALAGALDAKLEHATKRLTAEIRSIQNGLLTFPGEPLGYIGPVVINPFLSLCAAPPLHAGNPPLMSSACQTCSHQQLSELADLPELTGTGFDLDEVRKLRAKLSQDVIGRSTWLMVADRFRRWLDFSSGHSDLVLVEGNFNTALHGKLSSLSLFCGSFIEARKAPHFQVLFHFCGLHAYSSDPLSGPRGMLRSLAAQLLRWHESVGTPLTITLADPQHGDLSSHQLPALLALFRELVLQTPTGMTLYCLVDGISEFETTNYGWESELCETVTSLQTLVDELLASVSGPAFKVLLTTAQRSITVGRQISVDDQIALSSSKILPPSSGASFEEQLLAAMADSTT
ncbi:hypothetical protein QBC34DRAFT_101728 [Podospora aff. communis PSN243]|uniref:Nephrocystin 3-like N-terminal domain-containing protein n=1 Tax=Podospora aff. communis PSN243 TaxID=3040156 RepID=A0AAV9GLB4_9PEZI|nr:hypothetical protein QBC34DRAFT_101728 [Podospora aff. communis PSN243]